jgi:hypothetical protein
MKKIIVLLVVGLLLNFSSYSKPKYTFFLQNDYKSSKQLFVTLSGSGTNSVRELFFWCCDCIMYYSRVCGVTYAFMNILLFVVLQPLLIGLFFILWLRERNKRKKLIKLHYR